MNNTQDLSTFGYRELEEASELLMAYAQQGADFLNSNIQLNFNTHSGIVFLTDDDLNVGVLEGGKLVQFYNCSQCGWEGTAEDLENEDDDVKREHALISGYVEHAEEDEAENA